MMAAGTLYDVLLDQLRDVYDSETQLVKVLPALAQCAHASVLRAALQAHLIETLSHIERLETVFVALDAPLLAKYCDGMAGIVEEGRSVVRKRADDVVTDACLISVAQRVEHYQLAAYGTLVAWAHEMGHGQAAALLQLTLEDKKRTDEMLSALANGGINRVAALRGAGRARIATQRDPSEHGRDRDSRRGFAEAGEGD